MCVYMELSVGNSNLRLCIIIDLTHAAGLPESAALLTDSNQIFYYKRLGRPA